MSVRGRRTVRIELFGEPTGFVVKVHDPQGSGSAGPFPGGLPHTFSVLMNDFVGLPPLSARQTRKLSRRQEAGLAEDTGGTVQKGSGALWYLKGDVRVRGQLRIEAKFTRTPSYRITTGVLQKIREECAPGERPVLAIDFLNPSTNHPDEQWVAIPRDLFLELLNGIPKKSGGAP